MDLCKKRSPDRCRIGASGRRGLKDCANLRARECATAAAELRRRFDRDVSESRGGLRGRATVVVERVEIRDHSARLDRALSRIKR